MAQSETDQMADVRIPIGVAIVLQVPPVGWNFPTMGGLVLRGGHVEPTTKPKPGEVCYVAHAGLLCKPK